MIKVASMSEVDGDGVRVGMCGCDVEDLRSRN